MENENISSVPKTKLVLKDRKCPKCGSCWDGGSILEHFKKSRDEGNPHNEDKTDSELEEMVALYYGDKQAHWRTEIRFELSYDHPNHYDGISYWQCPDCMTTWNRFTRASEEIPEIKQKENGKS